MTRNKQRAAELYDVLTDHSDPEAAIADALDAAEVRGYREGVADAERGIYVPGSAELDAAEARGRAEAVSETADWLAANGYLTAAWCVNHRAEEREGIDQHVDDRAAELRAAAREMVDAWRADDEQERNDLSERVWAAVRGLARLVDHQR
jgi:ABC-type nitrate/sulfonate/bicarbonate transport system substrate-binding protein